MSRASNRKFSNAKLVNALTAATSASSIANCSQAPEALVDVSDFTASQRLITEISDGTGYSLARIAKEAQLSKATVTALANGNVREPLQRTWNRLLYLYFATCYG